MIETSERTQARTGEQQQETGICPECAGDIEREGHRHELVCADCGLVISDTVIDLGPEWRSFSDGEQTSRSRVGAPTTQLMHDRGLSTNIDWRDVDAAGKVLSAGKRRRMHRLRTWNERFRTRDSKERNLKHALGEIDRMASGLGIPEPTRETAGVIYRRALTEDLLPGRSIEGMATAALYAASRMDGIARAIDEMVQVSRVEPIEIKRTYRYLVGELALTIPPTDPMEYVGRLASALDVSEETEHEARQLIEIATSAGVHSGKHPVGIAASALYAAGRLCAEELTQSAIAEVAQISEVTIRNRYKEVLAAAEAVR